MSRDFAGRYVIQRTTIGSTGSIGFDATADRPDFSGPNAGHSLAWVTLTDVKAGVAGDIDPGDLLDVCGDAAAKCARKLKIAAITCAADGTCSAAAWVTDAERGALIAAKAKSFSVYVHPKGTKP